MVVSGLKSACCPVNFHQYGAVAYRRVRLRKFRTRAVVPFATASGKGSCDATITTHDAGFDPPDHRQRSGCKQAAALRFVAALCLSLTQVEVVLELSYQGQLDPWFTVQPDLQYIFNPSGGVLDPNDSPRRDALVLGLRSAITF